MWDESWLEDKSETPIQWENHRRHHIVRPEQKESEGEEEDPRIINVWLFDGYHNLYRSAKEEDNSNEGEDADGEEGEEEGEEEEYEEFEENEEDCEEEEYSKENRRNN